MIDKGKRYGKLVVLNEHGRSTRGHVVYKCQCDCGNTTNVYGSNLKNGNTKSCGCLQRKRASQASKLPDKKGLINIVYRKYFNGAKARNFNFNLTKPQFEELIKDNCFYCGATPSNTVQHPDNPDLFHYNGIDRVDNHVGYEYDNCVSCCFKCNKAKSTMSQEEFFEWVRQVNDWLGF